MDMNSLILLIFLCVLSGGEASLYGLFFGEHHELTLESSVNPKCGNQCRDKSVNFVDIGERSSNRRWLWDVTHLPAFYSIFTSEPNTNAHVDWPNFISQPNPKSLSYGSEDPLWTSSVIFESLVEFNDTNDDMKLNYSKCGMDESYCRTYSLYNCTWDRELLVNTTTHLTIQFVSQHCSFNDMGNDKGKINITVSAFIDDGYGYWLPHLAHSYRTCEVDVQLDGIQTGSNFTNGRFSILMLVDSSSSEGSFSRRQTESLNDEHTPGIFETNELIFSGMNKSQEAYIQWRPVVYSKHVRGLADSTRVFMSKGIAVTALHKYFNLTSLYAIYGNRIDQFLARRYLVSFGAPNDGFYNKTQYNAWTFTLGHGEPIDGNLSRNVIIASTFLGIIVVISIMVSSSFCLYKRWKNRNTEPHFSYGQI
ncbi:glycosylated lysosomal membrane protein A [Lepeophtheirus salmonis]|uniref:glycosylated lysosomal membrane protein A n=1 Tax=Lepeophtheirus salmonis TaxID=72036 RepID=UPI001AE3B741|nr:glycosylated lysosomal membrane protein B-like [Lepeophtheirus salmonis]